MRERGKEIGSLLEEAPPISKNDWLPTENKDLIKDKEKKYVCADLAWKKYFVGVENWIMNVGGVKVQIIEKKFAFLVD